MNVLGIETSCDETSVAIVRDGRDVLSNVVSSSLSFHEKYGGVIPEIASRMQLETIAQVAEEAVSQSRVGLGKIGLISVAGSPGLLGSLLTGISFARSLGFSLGVPVVEVSHIYSHIYANLLGKDKLPFPFVALVVSGGHTSLFYLRDFHKIEILGETLDDACGEAFDKVAKILGLGYPGGPLIEEKAKSGNPHKIRFACSGTKNALDFSFSGIKTAVLYYARSHLPERITRNAQRKTQIADICASFQEAALDALARKAFLACELKKVKRLVIGGGVAANQRLRDKFFARAEEDGVACYFPQKSLCTDNAAMVAGLGFQLYRKGGRLTHAYG